MTLDSETNACNGEGRGLFLTQDLEPGVWHHIAVTLNESPQGVYQSIFLDGKLNATRPPSFAATVPCATINPLRICDRLAGAIDDVRVSHGIRYSGNFSRPRQIEADADTEVLLRFDDAEVRDEGPYDRLVEVEGQPTRTTRDLSL